MRCRDHDTDPLSLQGSRPESSDEPNAGQYGVENITVFVRNVAVSRANERR
jgi:hypothetical protein